MTKIMSKAIIAITLLILCSQSYSSDFGIADWGMSKAEIKNLEIRGNITPITASNYLVYTLKIPGVYKARLIYQFQADQLVEGRFIFTTQNQRDTTAAVMQYNTIKDLMNTKYGSAVFDQALFSETNTPPLSSENYPNELASDRLVLKSNWKSDRVNIVHQLAWNGSEPHHQLHYRSTVAVTNTTDSGAF